MPLRVLVLGEGKSEEGDGYYQPVQPGRPIPEELLGAAHVLVRRILVERGGLEVPSFVYPPRLVRGAQRRPGNGGLISDLKGAPRFPENRRKGWLQLCVGANAVDLIVLLKDCKIRGNACGVGDVIGELQSAIAGRLPPGPVPIVKAGARPCLEAWLLLHPEASPLLESEAKARWARQGFDPGDPASMAGEARNLDLARLAQACPEGFGRLLDDLLRAVRKDEAPEA